MTIVSTIISGRSSDGVHITEFADGLAVGPFVVHRNNYQHADTHAWCVTHRPTGRRCCAARTRNDAIKAARQLRKLPMDWSSEDHEFVHKASHEVLAEARRISANAWSGTL